MTNIKFNEVTEDIFKKMRIRSKVVRNINNPKCTNEHIGYRNCKTPQSIIMNCFGWHNTPEETVNSHKPYWCKKYQEAITRYNAVMKQQETLHK